MIRNKFEIIPGVLLPKEKEGVRHIKVLYLNEDLQRIRFFFTKGGFVGISGTYSCLGKKKEYFIGSCHDSKVHIFLFS